MTRHEFLKALHTLLNPRLYLEIGVQHGESLRLSTCPAIGVDPAPHVAYEIPNAQIVPETSNHFFANSPGIPNELDLAFIDGSHLAEDALQDFLNIERYANPHTVIVFDDVLPYNAPIASRTQPPGGDWTGDVWKVWYWLLSNRMAHEMALVDTFPTGSLIVWNLYEFRSEWLEPIDPTMFQDDWDPPAEIIGRHQASNPHLILQRIQTWKDNW